jgi:hypothetical protein
VDYGNLKIALWVLGVVLAFGGLLVWSRPLARSVCILGAILSGCGLIVFHGYGTYAVPDRALAYNHAVELALVKTGVQVTKDLKSMRCTPDRSKVAGPVYGLNDDYEYKYTCVVSLDGMKGDFVVEKIDVEALLRESVDGKLNLKVTRLTTKDGIELPRVEVYAMPERVSAGQAADSIRALMAYALPRAIAKRDADVAAEEIEKANRASWQGKSDGS